jgi:hypothetical protein
MYEGLPYPIPSEGDSSPNSIHNTHALKVGDGLSNPQPLTPLYIPSTITIWGTLYSGGQFAETRPGPYVAENLYVEDYTKEPDPNSLCSILDAGGFSDCAGCDPDFTLIGASSQDWCLKQIGESFHRERCTNPTAVGTTGWAGYSSSIGTYLLDGYDSIIRFAPASASEMLVEAVKMTLAYLPTLGTNSTISLRIGISGQVADPNTDNCIIKWFSLSDKQLKCLNQFLSQSDYAKNNAVPNIGLEWNFQYSGKYVYFELKISGTGGDTLLGGVNAQVRAIPMRNF